jgi:lysozyme
MAFSFFRKPEAKPKPVDLVSLLKRDEGVRLFPYRDTVGKWTIGAGRNLDDVGISPDEVDYLLRNDIRRAEVEARKYPWYAGLNEVRKAVILSMIFNLGAAGFAGFKNTHASIAAGNYEDAASRMLMSKWASQTGNRAIRLAQMMRTGEA